jgi:hypothetical protein
LEYVLLFWPEAPKTLDAGLFPDFFLPCMVRYPVRPVLDRLVCAMRYQFTKFT